MADERKIGAVEIGRLYDFLDGLQASGYTIDPRQYLALSDLLMALIARGDSLEELPLKTLIAPLICTTPLEQQDFYQRFDHWYATLLPIASGKDRLDELTDTLLDLINRKQRRFPTISRTAFLWTLGAGILVALFGWLALNWRGTKTIQVNPNLAFYGVFIALFAATVWIGWRIWILVQENQYITRELANEELIYTKVPVKAYIQNVMPVMQLKPIVSALRKRTQFLSSEVDVDKTIENALNRNNWLEIVYRQRQVMPEYVVLIDRKSRFDQQARFVQEVLAKLTSDGVWLHQYEFNGDPRICFPLDRKDTPLRLKDLQARHPDSRLLIFSGTNELINPLTGLFQDWLESLSYWQERAILTPDKLQKVLLEELQARDFAVLPMTFDGLASLVRTFETDNAALLTNGGAGLPTQLTERPMRWTGRDTPPEAEVKALVKDVKIYLGENGFYWLCATAVYPELRWELTLHLGSALKDDFGQSLLASDLLIRLARLPWFRFGYMPDWIRLALVESFSGQQEILVREVLIGLLSSLYQGQEFDLIFSRKSDTPLKSSIQRFLRVLKRISPAESLLQDQIFIDFIAERQIKKLSIALPESVRKVLAEATKSKSAIHTKITTLDRNNMSVIWDYFRRLWLVYRGRLNLAEPYIFSSHEVISPAFVFHVSYLLQGTYLNLHPTLYAVCIFADGSIKRFDNGGLITPFPPGKAVLHYVDKMDRQSDLLKVVEYSIDAAVVTLAVRVIYRVLDPIKVFEIQKPVETLFSLIQSDLKQYIRSKRYEDLIGDVDSQMIDSSLVAKYIKQQHSTRYPMSQIFNIIDVVVQEKEGDPVFTEKRKSYKPQMVNGETKMNIQNLSKETAFQEKEIDQQKNEPDVEQVHNITYRQEILSRFFGFIKSVDSFYVIGAARMGKTRLLDFLMRNDVQEYYLGYGAQKTWLVRVDLNQIPVADNWEFYFFELLLSSILQCCISRNNVNEEIMKELVDLDSEVIKSRNILIALRFFYLEVSKICQKYDIKLCFLFDEFDEAYSKMPNETFAKLRSVRDANKNHLLYVMFLRIPPKKLRASNDNGSFYELLSGNAIGIGPYGMTDTLNIIQNLEKDWNLDLPSHIKEKIGTASGGHPGIIKALMRLAKDPAIVKKMENKDWMAGLSKQRTIIDECEKIWLGLQKEEKLTLLAPLQGEKNIDRSVVDLLVLKGILKDGGVFSPFFEYYLKSGLTKV